MPATLFLYADRVRIVAGRYKAEHPRKFAKLLVGGAPRGPGGFRIGQTREALFETTAAIGVGRTGDSLSDRAGPSPAPGMVGGRRSTAQHSAEPRARGSPRGYGRRDEGTAV